LILTQNHTLIVVSAADIHLNLPQLADKALLPPLWIQLLLFLCNSRYMTIVMLKHLSNMSWISERHCCNCLSIMWRAGAAHKVAPDWLA